MQETLDVPESIVESLLAIGKMLYLRSVVISENFNKGGAVTATTSIFLKI